MTAQTKARRPEPRSSAVLSVASAVLVVLSALLLGSHFLRAGAVGIAVTCVCASLLLAIRRAWAVIVLQLGLVFAAFEWLRTALGFIQLRMAMGAPWLRLALILGAVIAVAFAGVALLQRRLAQHDRAGTQEPTAVALCAFGLTFATLAIVQLHVPLRMILLDRFVPGLGWAAAVGLGSYAAWVAEVMLDPRAQPRWRRAIWLVFSAVFFGQLLLGLAGVDRMLMTGELHVPVPAVIAAGPIFRGERFFMPVLFLSTVLLVGPAWCSHLCYIGAWDQAATRRQRRPTPLPRWAPWVRAGLLIAVVASALVLRWAGVRGTVAAALAGGFGVAGILVMLFWSRRTGTMAHCVVFCPLGLLANLLGKLSPFRLRISSACDQCGVCARVCRFDALRPEHLGRRRVGLSCSLCGDCVRTCRRAALGYWFLGLSERGARTAFIVLVVSLHATFVGLARL
jgi:ferredoxin